MVHMFGSVKVLSLISPNIIVHIFVNVNEFLYIGYIFLKEVQSLLKNEVFE